MNATTAHHVTANPSRRGKISCLTFNVREELNQRLENGERAPQILPWLNQLEPVQEVLKQLFEGVPVSPQNLSQWRLGGYQDWLRHQDALELAATLREEEVELDTEGQTLVTDCVATALGLQLAAAVRALPDQELNPKERWERLKELLHELERLRRGDHRAARVRLAQARWERGEINRLEAEQAAWLEKQKQKKLAVIDGRDRVEQQAMLMGGGLEAAWKAALKEELRADLKTGTLSCGYDGSVELKDPLASTPEPDPAELWFAEMWLQRHERMALIKKREQQAAARTGARAATKKTIPKSSGTTCSEAADAADSESQSTPIKVDQECLRTATGEEEKASSSEDGGSPDGQVSDGDEERRD